MLTILMFHTVLYLLAELCSRQPEPHCGVLCLYQQHSVFVGVCPLDHALQHFTLCVCVCSWHLCQRWHPNHVKEL